MKLKSKKQRMVLSKISKLNVFTSVLIFLSVLQCSSENKHQNKDCCSIIDQLMNNQLTSWNNGDIDAYMDFYWKSDSLQFIGSKGITYGWDTTLINYKKAYSTVEEMGTLTFENLNCKNFKNDSYLVNGKWHLKRNKNLKDKEGYYTLIWKKINGQWKIIYDHSS